MQLTCKWFDERATGHAGKDGIVAVDPLRITVGVQGLGLTGTETSQQLEEEYGVVAELATQQVQLLSPHHSFTRSLLPVCMLASQEQVPALVQTGTTRYYLP